MATITGAKISVNKLGEYLEATTRRRRSIIQGQKKPSAVIVTRYSDAVRAIGEYFKTGSLSALETRAEQLRNDSSGSDFAQQDRQLSADVIDGFVDIVDQMELEGLTVEASPSNLSDPLVISDVRVSITPHFLIRDAAKGGTVVGAIKLSFNKINPLTKKGGEYVATLLRQYLVERFGAAHVQGGLCFAIAIPSEIVVTAPKAYKSRLADIEAACEEVAARWPTA